VSTEVQKEIGLEIGHVLFIDIVGYSKLLIDEQRDYLHTLNEVVRRTNSFRTADAAGKLTRLPTGDGMALVFATTPDAPVSCALEIGKALRSHPELQVRMGIHSGPVSGTTDVNDRSNVAGAGINLAQRVMDCGDAGHILLSKRVADDLEQYRQWRSHLHDLGECDVKHDVRVHVFNFYTDDAGNSDLPKKVIGAAVQPRPVITPPAKKSAKSERPSICVLPFANMSGDPEQEYFSDGISEDIITDLSNISALHVVSRNTAFTFKGKAVDVGQVASQLKVSHVVEGSVRKAAGRVRITAQLIDAANDSHLWAKRYDRDLHDIFAIQDEISHAIVDALKLRLLPEEKKAIEHRGTDNADAYNLFLMARKAYATGYSADARRLDAIIRMCRRAVEIDPNYANAWALLALAEVLLRANVGRQAGDGGLAAAERALALNPDLAEAHAVKARILSEENRIDEASREMDIALQLDPESYEVNRDAALLKFRQKQIEEAAVYWEKALTLEEGDFGSAGMLVTIYTALGKHEAAHRAAQKSLERCEKVLARDSNNGAALGHSAVALAVLGQHERSKERMEYALLIDPDNLTMRYNFACDLANYINDKDAALEMLRPAFEQMGLGLVNHAKVDPDFDSIRDDPRFKEMLATAERRLSTSGSRERSAIRASRKSSPRPRRKNDSAK
jgi:adenylate cyclase